ncbi:MAG: DUF4129 domain-containing protein [Planctomycetota bacterium]|jgi:hypothetical protein
MAGIAALVVWVAVAAPSPEEVRAAAERVLDDAGYQTELPGDIERPEREDPSGLEEALPDWDSNPLDSTAVGAIARAIYWILIAVGLTLVALWVARELTLRGERRGRKETPTPAASPAPVPRADPEGLARQRRYTDAIHALLLNVLLDLVARLKAPLLPAWTSREVLARLQLAAEGRAALRGLVLAVERTHFGGAAADAEEYRRCAELARTLRAALPGGSGG